MLSAPPLDPTPRRVLLTGATGQDGFYLGGQLVASGARVFGLVRGRDRALPAGVIPLEGDLCDGASLVRAVEVSAPDEVYNLAARTFVPGSWDDPAAALDVNAEGLERLAAALLASADTARLCHASSAEIFGEWPGRPLCENDPLRPRTPYGQAKARAHRYVATLRERHGLFACSAVLFNHESPRRPPHFVTRKITRAAARIARGLESSLLLGDLGAIRDWGYAPEYTAAMTKIVRSDVPSDYVVATGRGASVGEFAALAFARAGLDWKEHVKIDAALGRGGDADVRIGDASRIARELGWRASTSLEDLVALMVDADLALLDD